MNTSRVSRGSRTQPPSDLRVRLFRGDDGRDYAALWFSHRRRGAAKLTEAEREVAEMIRAGFSNAAIAATRRVAPSTVATQVRQVFAKLGVSSRAQLVARGRRE
jgi:DNA-binding NarL/FixJ family response regulator